MNDKSKKNLIIKSLSGMALTLIKFQNYKTK